MVEVTEDDEEIQDTGNNPRAGEGRQFTSKVISTGTIDRVCAWVELNGVNTTHLNSNRFQRETTNRAGLRPPTAPVIAALWVSEHACRTAV